MRIAGFSSSRGLSAIGLLLAAATIAVAALAIWDLRVYAVENYRQNIRNLGSVLAEQVARTLQAVDLVLRETQSRVLADGIATQDQFRADLVTEDVHRFLQSELKSLPQADSVILVGADGKTVNFSRFWPNPPIDLSDRDYYQYLLSHDDAGMFVSEPVQNRVTGTWTIYLARRIDGRDGDFLGFVLVGIETAYFSGVFAGLSLDHGISAAVMRRDGLVLARAPVLWDAIGKRIPKESGWYEVVAAGGGMLRTPGYLDGIARTISLHPRADYPIVVAVTVDEHEALAPWRRQATLVMVAALCAVIGFALLFRMLASQFRRLEDQATALRRARDEANLANRSKSEFLANMSHELRTPLNSVIGFSDAILSGAVDSLGPERLRSYVVDIRASGQHLLSIINDLLDLAQIDAGRMRLEEREIDLGALAPACVSMVRVKAEARDIELVLVEPPQRIMVRVDERLLKQALLNLLANAIKFSPPRGQVRIDIGVEPGGAVSIAVVDQGIGMRPEDVVRAMQPFVQIDGVLQRRFEGTGLGLPLTQAMMVLHGGSLVVESHLGEGTTATLRLPADRRIASGTAAPASTPETVA